MSFVFRGDFRHVDRGVYDQLHSNLDYMLALADTVYNLPEQSYQKRDIMAQLVEFVVRQYPLPDYIACVTDISVMRERKQYMQNMYAMRGIEKDFSKFDQAFLNVLYDEKYSNFYSVNKFYTSKLYGLLLSFPKVYSETIERNMFEDEVYRIRNISEYIATPKSRINLKLKLISKRLIKHKGIWVVNAINDDQNLVTYFDNSRTPDTLQVGNFYKVRATITKHEFSSFTGCKETRINRVVYG